jgi:hypothetical protein
MSINTTSGLEFFDQGNRLPAVLRFADHFQVFFHLEHLAKALAHDRMIVRQQNSCSFHSFSRILLEAFIHDASTHAALLDGICVELGDAFAPAASTA